MKITVDHDICCGYGLCVETEPEVFAFGDDDKLTIVPSIPEELQAKARFACESCPAQALTLHE